MEEFLVRQMKTEDLETVHSLEEMLFSNPWTLEQYRYELDENPISNSYVIEVNSVICGFIVFWVTFNSSTICKIGVIEPLKRKGLGSILLETMIDDMVSNEVETITLEVRVTNQVAINFYAKHGFQVVTTKKNYYEDGTDAFYMVKVLI